MGKLSKKDIYYGCDSYDFEYFQPKPPKIRLQKLEDGFYTRHKRKGYKMDRNFTTKIVSEYF